LLPVGDKGDAGAARGLVAHPGGRPADADAASVVARRPGYCPRPGAELRTGLQRLVDLVGSAPRSVIDAKTTRSSARRSRSSCAQDPFRLPQMPNLQPAISKPGNVPLLVPNCFTSMPSRWSMVTYRLLRGGAVFGSKARWWPCLKPPPAS